MNSLHTANQLTTYFFQSLVYSDQMNVLFFVFFYFVQYFCMNVNTSNNLQTILKFQIFITKNENKC